MRFFRPIACAALVSSASACTIWYLATEPYKDDGDASADVQQQADALPDVVNGSTFERVLSNVSAIALYDDTVFASVGGQIYMCAPDCAQLMTVDASAAGRGIAVSDSGIAWTALGGIWVAALDGSTATQPITDDNNPQVVAADGPRVSWTTRDDAGKSVIHSCAHPRTGNGCKFTIVAGLDGGPTSGSGEGGATQLGPTGVIDSRDLAAGEGFVAWVSAMDQSVSFTLVNGDVTVSLPVPKDDPLFDGLDSTMSYVASDGTKVFFSYFQGKSNTDTILVRQTGLPDDAAIGTKVHYNTNTNHNYCLGAGHGRIVFGGTANGVYAADEIDGSARTTYNFGDADTAKACTATSGYVFILDNSDELYRAPRIN